MARLTEQEKAQLKEAAARTAKPPPARPPGSTSEYLAFLKFATEFRGPTKPVRFVGSQWKL